MKNRFALVLAGSLVAGIGAASAADMGARKAPPMAAPIAQVYNWSGFYIGGHVGYGFGEVDGSTSFLPSAALFGADNFTFGHDRDGWMAGGQIGFNYQVNQWVFGLEADLSWTDFGGSTGVAPLTFLGAPIIPSSFGAASDMNWFGTVRGRLGFAANNLLVYVTGGVAFADMDYAAVTSFGGPPFVAAGSDTNVGWTVGGGFEWGFAPNWSVKAEYLYYDLGDTTITSQTIPGGFAVATNFDNDGHIVRLGLNYRFGGAAPVVARY